MSFQKILDKYFPNAKTTSEFIADSYKKLGQSGFNARNTIACAGGCRDELTRAFRIDIQEKWGEAFDFSGLGGMIFLGKTGFIAAHQHSPIVDGKERYVYFVMPHIGIGEDGEIGQCKRPGRPGTSGACGALMAFRQELTEGKLDLQLRADDLEQSLLKQRLIQKIPYGNVPDLIELTKLAHDAIREDLEAMIAKTVDQEKVDYAIFSGIHIHSPFTEDYIWPGIFYTSIEGRKSDI